MLSFLLGRSDNISSLIHLQHNLGAGSALHVLRSAKLEKGGELGLRTRLTGRPERGRRGGWSEGDGEAGARAALRMTPANR